MNEFVAGDGFSDSRDAIDLMGWAESKIFARNLEAQNKLLKFALLQIKHSPDDKCADIAREALTVAERIQRGEL